MDTRKWVVNAARFSLFALLLSFSFPLVFAQETHPGGSWGAWLTLPQYPKLQMRVKCEYWITDQNDNNRAHSVWAIQYRSGYVRPMDVVQANTYYDTVLRTNKNWDAPGQFTIQPGQTADYGETSLLGACPKGGGASPINLAVYCVVPSGKADQSAACQAHGVPKMNAAGSVAASESNSPADAGAGEPSSSGGTRPKNLDWVCFIPYRDEAGEWRNVQTEVFKWYSDQQAEENVLRTKFYNWFVARHPENKLNPYMYTACAPADQIESLRKQLGGGRPFADLQWTPGDEHTEPIR